MQTTKVYSTKASKYSTVGRKNARIESKCITTEVMSPKYGRALLVHQSREKLNNLFNN